MSAVVTNKPPFATNNCGKRPVKRPIVGTRVCAPWQDGIYYPGVVRTMASKYTKSKTDLSYMVIFDDGYCKDYMAHQIIGPGFQSIATVHLKFNQRVFIAQNGREMSGLVQKHKKQTNEVFIKLDDSSETLIHRKLDDVRLLPMERRMFVDQQHHQKMANTPCSEIMNKRKGTQIHQTDLPSAKSPKVEEEPLMDDVMAAMVLTSLSASPLGGYRSRHNSNESTASSTTSDLCLPTSPRSPLPFGDQSFSPTSSGHFSWDMNSRGTPSPVSSTSDVECSSGHAGSMIFGPPSVDEGIDVREPSTLCSAMTDTKCPHKATIKTLYKCTWPGCGKTLCTVQGIEKHIRILHLRKIESGKVTDHEEEFYYTEIDTTVDTVSDTFANMYTSPPSPLHTPTHTLTGILTPPPEQCKELRPELLSDRLSPPLVQIVGSNNNNEQQLTVMSPVLITTTQQQPQPSVSYSWPTIPTTHFTKFQAAPQFTPSSPAPPTSSVRHKPSLVEQRQHQHQAASPKTSQHFVIPPKTSSTGSPVHTKIRSEGKKCRKVYGMDNRDLWCTQCRWKKACVRFT